MRTHRTVSGTWQECVDIDCTLPIHLPEMSAAEVARIPLELLLPLIHAFDPPHYTNGSGGYWYDSAGSVHRDYDLPAVVFKEGGYMWWQHGDLHREHDRPAIIRPDGSQEWHYGGKLHREHGPALIRTNGTQEWWYGGVRHREDGPAAIYPQENVQQFWVNGFEQRQEPIS